MPQIGFQCPGKVNPNGADLSPNVTFESRVCINSCVNPCLPQSVLVNIQGKLERDKHKGWYISVTSLLGCLRQLYLERTLDYYQEPSKGWYMLRGSILHSILENPGLESMIEDFMKEVWRRADQHGTDKAKVEKIIAKAIPALEKLAKLLPRKEIPNWEAETEYEYDTGLRVTSSGTIISSSREDNGASLSESGEETTPLMLRGTIDVLRPETGEMYDYKTIGDKGLGIIKNGAKPDHIMQFNLYRLLVERGHPVGCDNYVPIKINKITAFYMTMMQVVKTGGLLVETTPWRISDPASHPFLASTETVVHKQELKPKRGKTRLSTNPEDFNIVDNKRFRLTYAIPEVPLMDLEDCVAFVRKNVPLLYNGFVNGQMPPMCDPKERVWRCNDYCPDAVRQACDAYNLTTGEVREVPVDEEKLTDIPVEEI